MPVNLEELGVQLPEGMTPEVVEVKQRVIEVARNMAQVHGLCEVVENSLADAGVLDADTAFGAPLVLDVTIEAKIRVDVSAAELHGKSPEEINDYFSDKLNAEIKQRVDGIGVISLAGGAPRAPWSGGGRRGGASGSQVRRFVSGGSSELTHVEVTDANLWEAPPPPPSVASALAERVSGLNEGYELGFTSREGRVAHVVPTEGFEPRERRDGGIRLAQCGAQASTLAGVWLRDSNRSEGRVCRECQRRSGVRQL